MKMLPNYVTTTCYQKKRILMKTQIGVRIDSQIWINYKALCEKVNLRPNEAIELFLTVCVEKDNVNTVLNSLKSQSPSEKLACELKLKNLLLDFEYYFRSDEKDGKTEEYYSIDSRLKGITEILPQISDSTLLNQSKNLIEEALTYYHSKMIQK
jgi:hypothetical protein